MENGTGFQAGLDGNRHHLNVGRLRNRRFGVLGLFAGAIVFALSSVPAHSVPLTDNYYGGDNTYNNSDVIGDQTFSITGANVTRSTTTVTNDTLNVTINTWFAGAPGTSAADGTFYGSLFFSTASNPTAYSPTGSSPYPNDQYKPNEWNYAVTIPGSPNSNTGTSGLYSIGTVTATNDYSGNHSVVQTYTTQHGTITMSNVNGDPVTYPNSGHTTNPAYYFRQGQAVEYTPTDPLDSLGAVTWTIVPSTSTTEGSITFSILDDGLLGNSFVLSWAMTCANDVIQGFVKLPSNQQFTPLPTSFPLFVTGLGLIGLLGWHKKRKSKIALS